MGSPKKGKSGLGAIVSGATGGLERGVSDIGTGLEQIAQGNVERGIMNYGTGVINTLGYGAGERMGLKGERLMTEEANDAATADAEVAAKEASDIAAGRETARKDAIRKRLDAEISVRMKQPGRAQTLLSVGSNSLLPSGSNTLLTTGKGR